MLKQRCDPLGELLPLGFGELKIASLDFQDAEVDLVVPVQPAAEALGCFGCAERQGPLRTGRTQLCGGSGGEVGCSGRGTCGGGGGYRFPRRHRNTKAQLPVEVSGNTFPGNLQHGLARTRPRKSHFLRLQGYAMPRTDWKKAAFNTYSQKVTSSLQHFTLERDGIALGGDPHGARLETD